LLFPSLFPIHLVILDTVKWKKQVLDAFSHGSDVFATGRRSLRKKGFKHYFSSIESSTLSTGYWGLKNLVDPWIFPKGVSEKEDKCYPPSYIRKAHVQWSSLARTEALSMHKINCSVWMKIVRYSN
jgi:hypothetical protein